MRAVIGAFLIGLFVGCHPPLMAQELAISGSVREIGTGKGIGGATVRLQAVVGDAMKEFTATSTQDGQYKLVGIPSGSHRIVAFQPERILGATGKTVVVGKTDLDGIEILMQAQSEITGKVVNIENRPLPATTVYLVAREYYKDRIEAFIKFKTVTDERGVYRISAPVGQEWILFAERHSEQRPIPSQVPTLPQHRAPFSRNTWYPNSPNVEGAAPLTLQQGVTMEGINFKLPDSTPLCVSGRLMTPFGPAPSQKFTIQTLQPAGGMSNSGYASPVRPGGITGPDGRFRICDLERGAYWIHSSVPGERGAVPLFGETTIDLDREDVENLTIPLQMGQSVPWEITLVGPSQEQLPDLNALIFVEPLRRTPPVGQDRMKRSSVPGMGVFPGVATDEYGVRVVGLPTAPLGPARARVYVRDIQFGGRSILHSRLRTTESGSGTGLKVEIGTDGGSITVNATTREGGPLSDQGVVLFPETPGGYGALADVILSGSTTSNGGFQTGSIAPGKYYVACTDVKFNSAPESVDRLWRSRSRFTELELKAAEEKVLTFRKSDCVQ